MKAKKKLLSVMLCMLVIGTYIPLTSAMNIDKKNINTKQSDKKNIMDLNFPGDLFQKIILFIMIFFGYFALPPPYWEGGYH